MIYTPEKQTVECSCSPSTRQRGWSRGDWRSPMEGPQPARSDRFPQLPLRRGEGQRGRLSTAPHLYGRS